MTSRGRPSPKDPERHRSSTVRHQAGTGRLARPAATASLGIAADMGASLLVIFNGLRLLGKARPDQR